MKIFVRSTSDTVLLNLKIFDEFFISKRNKLDLKSISKISEKKQPHIARQHLVTRYGIK